MAATLLTQPTITMTEAEEAVTATAEVLVQMQVLAVAVALQKMVLRVPRAAKALLLSRMST
jgi:hypothetical protein